MSILHRGSIILIFIATITSSYQYWMDYYPIPYLQLFKNEECKIKLNLTDNEYNALNTSKIPQNEMQSCYLDCLGEITAMIRDGEIAEKNYLLYARVENRYEMVKYKRIEQVFQNCKSKAKKSSGEKCGIMKNLMICMDDHKNMPL